MKFIKSISGKVGLATLAAGAWASVALAQTTINGAEIQALGPVNADQGITATLTNLINIGLAIVGILAVVYLVYGGLLYITAGGDAEKAGKGRTAITNAIIGIVIILAALIIYNGVIGSFKGNALN